MHGGVVPYLARRFAVIDEMAVLPDEDGTRASAADTFRRLYWDTALSWSDTTLHTLRAVAGIDHVRLRQRLPASAVIDVISPAAGKSSTPSSSTSRAEGMFLGELVCEFNGDCLVFTGATQASEHERC